MEASEVQLGMRVVHRVRKKRGTIQVDQNSEFFHPQDNQVYVKWDLVILGKMKDDWYSLDLLDPVN